MVCETHVEIAEKSDVTVQRPNWPLFAMVTVNFKVSYGSLLGDKEQLRILLNISHEWNGTLCNLGSKALVFNHATKILGIDPSPLRFLLGSRQHTKVAQGTPKAANKELGGG